MSTVAGLGTAALPADPAGTPAWAHEMAASLDALGMSVRPENMLKAAKILVDEGLRVADEVRMCQIKAVVRKCGGDPVSADAAVAFNERLKPLIDQARLVSDMLTAAGQGLATASREYGHSDAAIAATLARVRGTR